MGWTTSFESRDRTIEGQMKWTHTDGSGRTEALKHSRKGQEDWFLYATYNADGSLKRKWIAVTLWESGSHKEMSISMGPYCFGCPQSWLREIEQPDPIEDEYAYDWYMKMLGKPVNRCEECHKLDCQGHLHELISMSAYGSWATNVPEGMVGLVCRYGGRSNKDGADEYRLVTAEAYDKRSEGHAHYFVVPEDAPEWEYDAANPYKPSQRKAQEAAA